MTQEDKRLLLIDLCARLSYGVKVLDNSHKNYGVSKLINIGDDGSILIDNEINDLQYYPIIDEIKPYLRPMSSMTKEEYKELKSISSYYGFASYEYIGDWCPNYEMVDWLNAHYFDYRGLIEKGLAIEASKGMYNTE